MQTFVCFSMIARKVDKRVPICPFFLAGANFFFGGAGEITLQKVVFCARACYNGDMNARMKLFLGTVFGAAMLLLFAGVFARGALSAEAEPSAELFLPGSFEQYLPLEHPADVAMNDSYIVVADGSSLYIYDKDAAAYERYDHLVQTLGGLEPRNITKIGFTSDGRLFFSDQDTHLFLYGFATKEAQIQSEIPCSTFLIDGDTLYTAAVANGRTTFLAFPHRGGISYDRSRTIGSLDASTSISPHLFVLDGVLHCAVNSMVYLYRDNGVTFEPSWKPLAGEEIVQDLTSVAVLGGKIYYTVNGAIQSRNGLYTTTLEGGATLLLPGDGFNALSVYREKLYCVKGATVRELETDGTAMRYTGYEIAADSDSPNRLAQAGDTVRARDLIVTADCGNARLSVYNTRTGEFGVLDSGVANCVATDGYVIAAGVGSSVLLYRYGEETPYYVHTTANAVTGVAVVFGRCYYVTEHHYGVAEEGAVEITRANSPTALTSDVYGNLYVADQQNRVLRYTEEEFFDRDFESGELMTDGWQLPGGYRSLRADFGGGLYYLYENAVYQNGTRLATADASGCVYLAKREMPDLVSFALGFEDNKLYFQYGSFMTSTENVSFPSLSTIPAGDAYKEVFSTPERDRLSFTEVTSGATGIRVDAANLGEESVYFPYVDYYRTPEGGKGIEIAERGDFRLVALFENHDYTIALYPADACTEVPLLWEDVLPAARYTASEVALSYYPCLSEPLTIERLPRATELTLLATVECGGMFGFGYVRYGNTAGYVPLSYLSETMPVPSLPDEYTLGYLKASEEGVLFRAENGDTLLVTERTQVKIYEGKNNLYFVRFTKDGVEYTAQVTDKMIQTGDPDALRVSLIIVLSVVAVGVVAAYVLFVPHKKKKKK